MVKFTTAHQGDDEGENTEVVGSKDLRESFKDGGKVRGSFSINGHEFKNFEANSPAAAVAAINAGTGVSGVTASIDDGAHIVLENNSTLDIRIKQGAPFDDSALPDNQKLNRDDDGKVKNNVLDDLGLSATDEDAEGDTAQAGFETGMSAEDRAERRGKQAEQGTASVGAGGTAGAGQTRDPSRNPTAPVGEVEGSGGRMAGGAGRIGQGEGYSAKPDGTPATPGTPANPGNERGNPAANVQHQSDPA